MAIQFTAGRFKGFADDGSPLAGGRLYTYESGTTTHKAAFADSTLSTPCAYVNDGTGALYISLNARGEAPVWLGGGVYTFDLRTSDGVTVWTVDGVSSSGASGGASSGAGTLPHDVLPYVRADITPAPTSSFAVNVPDVEAVFDGVQVDVPAWSRVFDASTVTDVWLSSTGSVSYESVALTNWSALPRYADRLHLYRIQTSGIQVTGIFVRANPTVTRDATTFDDLSASSFIRDYVVPTTDYLGYSPWVPGASVQADTFRVSGQNIWVVVKDGVLGAAPADPVYNTSVIGGISNLSDVVSGTATVRFAGKVYLSGAIKQARASGVRDHVVFAHEGFQSLE